MFLSDKTMRLLVDSGLAPDKLVEILQSLRADEAAAAPVKSSAAIRQARYRHNKAQQSITRVTVGDDSDASVTVRDVCDAPASRARVGDIKLTSVDTCSAVAAAVVAREPDPKPDDWPSGKRADHATLLVEAVASPRLDPSKSQGLVLTRGRLAAWKAAGASWEHDVLPVVTALCAKQRSPVQSWKFFDDAIAKSVADNRAALEIPEAGKVVRLPSTGPPRSFDEKSDEAWRYAMRRIAEDG